MRQRLVRLEQIVQPRLRLRIPLWILVDPPGLNQANRARLAQLGQVRVARDVNICKKRKSDLLEGNA